MNKINNMFKYNSNIFIIIILLFFVSFSESKSQVESSALSFNRGQLWQSVFFGKVGPNFNNWARRGIGLDWPGFDDTWISENIGGPASHLASGGFWVGCKKSKDSVYTVEDWSMYAGTISNDAGAKYIITKHRHVFKNGENYWLKTNPLVGEEVIETTWEMNKNYTNIDDREYQLPLRVTREAHQWSGSKRDENYIIYRYVFKNISPEIKKDTAYVNKVADTLYGFYALLSYAIHCNSRSWNVLFPTLTPGARNTYYFYDPARRLLYARAGKYRDAPGDQTYGYTNSLGLIVNGKPQGEWLAPAFAGVKLLYSSPDTFKIPNRVNQWGWSAANNSNDQSGPFTGVSATREKKYEVLSDITKTFQYVNSPTDTNYMQRSRMWSMMSLGPYTILPNDSIVIAIAEIVDGIDYKLAVDPATTASLIGQKSSAIFFQSADKAQFTWDNLTLGTDKALNHPDPPAAPKFTVDFYKGKEKFMANQIEWGTETEDLPDPDDGIKDLFGYKLYRSSFLPIGPWDSIATIIKGDPKYFDPVKKKYIYIDSLVQLGINYYYALTAFDTGKVSWPQRPTFTFTPGGTPTKRVPSLESSIFANRTVKPFKATLAAAKNLDEIVVVPNPFIIGEGYSQPGAGDDIQFVGLPNPCTIRIYTVRGDLVKTIDVPEGAGSIASWNQVTDYGQFVESGVYLFQVDAPGVGKKIGKFAIVR